jgi:hypothetical protein
VSVHDDGRDFILSMGPQIARDTRMIAWVMQDRWAKAKQAAQTKGEVLVSIRCPDCRSTLARVYATAAGALYEAHIEASKLDQLEQEPSPWIRDKDLRELSEEALGDDGQLISESTRPNTPRMPWDKLSPTGDGCIVIDLLEPPPAPDGGVPIHLWVRCRDHPRTPSPGDGMSVISYLQTRHPAGGTVVSRQELIASATLASQSRQQQQYEVPRPSTP